jgi:hypothetical protein
MVGHVPPLAGVVCIAVWNDCVDRWNQDIGIWYTDAVYGRQPQASADGDAAAAAEKNQPESAGSKPRTDRGGAKDGGPIR